MFIVFSSEDGQNYSLSTVEGPTLDLAYRQVKVVDGGSYYIVNQDHAYYIRYEAPFNEA